MSLEGETEFQFPGDSVCFGCSHTNPAGLRMRFFLQGDAMLSRYVVPETLCGAPGKVHGGILATLIDEVSCAVVVALKGSRVVTGELTVRYVAACRVGEEVLLRASIVEERPRYFVVACTVSQAGIEVARSTARIFPVRAHAAE